MMLKFFSYKGKIFKGSLVLLAQIIINDLLLSEKRLQVTGKTLKLLKVINEFIIRLNQLMDLPMNLFG